MFFHCSPDFENGIVCYKKGEYDAAFEHFTNVLKFDENNVGAMEKRAFIHFEKKEYEDCIIECEEIIKIQSIPQIIDLMKKAEEKIPKERSWFDFFGVPANSDKSILKTAFKKLALKFSPNTKINARLINIDKKKVARRMSKINEARMHFTL